AQCSYLLDSCQQFVRELPDLLEHFRAWGRARFGDTAHERRADDEAVGYWRQPANVLGLANTEADTDWQRCALAQPGHALQQLIGQALPFARDARYRHIVDEAARRFRNAQ